MNPRLKTVKVPDATTLTQGCLAAELPGAVDQKWMEPKSGKLEKDILILLVHFVFKNMMIHFCQFLSDFISINEMPIFSEFTAIPSRNI